MCGTFRHDKVAEIQSRTAALLQTCDIEQTTLRQLLFRLTYESGRPGFGLYISQAELKAEVNRQLQLRGRLSTVTRSLG